MKKVFVVHRNDIIFMVTDNEELSIAECLRQETNLENLTGYHLPVDITAKDLITD